MCWLCVVCCLLFAVPGLSLVVLMFVVCCSVFVAVVRCVLCLALLCASYALCVGCAICCVSCLMFAVCYSIVRCLSSVLG